MKAKLKFIIPIPIVLVVLAAAYMFLLAPKKAAAKPPKVDGTLVPLTGDFVINLAGGHYGKLSVAVLMSSPPPVTTGAVALPEDAAVRLSTWLSRELRYSLDLKRRTTLQPLDVGDRR